MGTIVKEDDMLTYSDIQSILAEKSETYWATPAKQFQRSTSFALPFLC